MHESPLFAPGCAAIACSLLYTDESGWKLSVASRAVGGSWPIDGWSHYERLTFREAIDVVESEVSRRLVTG